MAEVGGCEGMRGLSPGKCSSQLCKMRSNLETRGGGAGDSVCIWFFWGGDYLGGLKFPEFHGVSQSEVSLDF